MKLATRIKHINNPFKELSKLKAWADDIVEYGDSKEGVNALLAYAKKRHMSSERQGPGPNHIVRIWLGGYTPEFSAIGLWEAQALHSWGVKIIDRYNRVEKAVKRLQNPKVYRKTPTSRLAMLYHELRQEQEEEGPAFGSAEWIIMQENFNALDREFKVRDKARRAYRV